jgi:hypothetical protein
MAPNSFHMILLILNVYRGFQSHTTPSFMNVYHLATSFNLDKKWQNNELWLKTSLQVCVLHQRGFFIWLICFKWVPRIVYWFGGKFHDPFVYNVKSYLLTFNIKQAFSHFSNAPKNWHSRNACKSQNTTEYFWYVHSHKMIQAWLECLITSGHETQLARILCKVTKPVSCQMPHMITWKCTGRSTWRFAG